MQHSIGNRATAELVQTIVQRHGDHGLEPPGNYPWEGMIHTGWNVALRERPGKSKTAPHAGTLADLPNGTSVRVIGRSGGWLQVEVVVETKKITGYVSHELVRFVRNEPPRQPPPTTPAPPQIASIAEAFVILKRAEKNVAVSTPTIEAAVDMLTKTTKYVVDSATYRVTFAPRGGKIKIRTIEDFILFVETVERTYPGASRAEIATELRQIWFSNTHWELMVAGQGITQGNDLVDIETEPNPIAVKFDLVELTTTKGASNLATRFGIVDIGHVLAGIDARLSGFPAEYPLLHLRKRGRDVLDESNKLIWESLRKASGGDIRDFATWSGDLGQAYGEYLVDRWIKGGNDKLDDFVAEKASDEQLKGDIHGYIAVRVWQNVPASKSPTGSEQTVSAILRDMYLVEKDPGIQGGYEALVAQEANLAAADLAAHMRVRCLEVARLWFAKAVVSHRGFWGSKGWTRKTIMTNAMEEFDKKHLLNEAIAPIEDRLGRVLTRFTAMLRSGKVK